MNLFSQVEMLVGAAVEVGTLAPVGLKILGIAEWTNTLGHHITCGVIMNGLMAGNLHNSLN